MTTPPLSERSPTMPAQVEGDNIETYSVSALAGAVRTDIETHFGRIRVRGELGRISRPNSGHIYLDLKDDSAVLAGVIWRHSAGRLSVQLETGLEVVATGRLTTYAPQSRYQIQIDDLQPAGEGALMALLRARMKALSAEGLFDESRKPILPYLPRTIGVVTSPSGAVIRDILHRLSARFPCDVLVWPVRVQGRDCAAEVASAVAGFNALAVAGDVVRPDVIIVARGGGSLEDLWGFNEEIVARAVSASLIPVISAVGHETDTTLIDYAASRRAPTPSAAAEIVVPVRADLVAQMLRFQARLARAVRHTQIRCADRIMSIVRIFPLPERLFASSTQRLDIARMRLGERLREATQNYRINFDRVAMRLVLTPLTHEIERRRAALRIFPLPERLFASSTQRLDITRMRLGERLRQATQNYRINFDRVAMRLVLTPLNHEIERRRAALFGCAEHLSRVGKGCMSTARQRFESATRDLELLSHKAVLARGFALVRTAEGIVRRADQAPPGTILDIHLDEGDLAATTIPKQSKLL